MNTLNLKQKLLSTNLFIDNDQLSQYLAIVTNSYSANGYTELHQILPWSFYKHNKLPIDDSVANTVMLSYADHCKAHWLLYYCTIGYLKSANANAVLRILNRYNYIAKKCCNTISELDDSILQTLQAYMDNIVQDPDSAYYSEEAILFLKEHYT